MGIWENLGMGGYRGFSRPAARLLQQAVQLAGDLGCEQADTSHLLLAMLRQQGAAAQFLTRKNITEPEVRRQLAAHLRFGDVFPGQKLRRSALLPQHCQQKVAGICLFTAQIPRQLHRLLQQPRRRARKAPVTAHTQIFPNAHVSAPCCI